MTALPLPSHMPALHDPEGSLVPSGLPPVVDGHVHLFPDRVFNALWRWFAQYGWPIRYPLHSEQVIDFLLAHGVEHIVGLHYAHKPGMARNLNRYMADLCAGRARVTGLATVFPGEPHAVAILEEAWAAGLRGVKLHCHVQCFAPDDPALHEIYALCAARGSPLVMHAGRAPWSSGYRCNPNDICGAERISRVLKDYPRLRLCVPHLGADEFEAYASLLARFDNLWLDTTMMLSDYLPDRPPDRVLTLRPERMFYGSDFPNLPYAWDRELLHLRKSRLPDDTLARLLNGTARDFFQLAM